MVFEEDKPKRAKLSSNKAESGQVEDFAPCLEDEVIDNSQELMDLYEEQEEGSGSKINSFKVKMDHEDIPAVFGHFGEMKQGSQGTQASTETEEEMVQCVPEMVGSQPLPLQSTKINKLKENRRPKFKVTPTRREIAKAEKKISKKIKLSRTSKVSETRAEIKKLENSKTSDQNESGTLKDDKEGTWVQCSRVDCLKWRKLPNDIEPTTMPERWVCAMNPDQSRMECAASQETCDSDVDYDVVYTPFVVGSLVWAKVPGYPWWPGMVEDDPDYNCYYETDESSINPVSYHVSFIFDKDVSRSWVSYLCIRAFSGTENPNESNSRFKKHSRPLLKALTQARTALDLPIRERLSKFGFRILYHGPIGRGTVDDNYKMNSSPDSQPSTSPQDSVLFDDKKKTEKVNKLEKSKKPKELKCSHGSGEKAKFTSKIATSCLDEHNTAKDYCADAESKNMRVILTKKKKRKRIIVFSEDEYSEQENEVMSETVPNTNSGRKLVNMTRSSTDEKTYKKSGKKKGFSGKKINYVERKTSECRSSTSEDAMRIEEHDTVKWKAVEDNKREHEMKSRKDDSKVKIEQNHTKELTERSKISKENESVPNKVEKKGHGSKKKKQKLKVTEEEDIKDLASGKTQQEKEQESLKDLKQTQAKKKKAKKQRIVPVIRKDLEEISPKEKKKIRTDCIKPGKKSISSGVGESSCRKENPANVPGKEYVNHRNESNGSEIKSSSQHPIVDNGVDTQRKVISQTKRKIEDGTVDQKKGKNAKRTIYAVSSFQKMRENGEGMAAKSVQATDVAKSSAFSRKKIKSGLKPIQKKTAFGTFKAPVKSYENAMPIVVNRTEASLHKITKSANHITNKEQILKKHGKTNREKRPEPDSAPQTLDFYVSIETLEKDISNLYQQLSETETTPGFLEGASKGDRLSKVNETVSMAFLENELTMNEESYDTTKSRCLTDSPEY